MLHKLNFDNIKEHYSVREQTHYELIKYFTTRDVNNYLNLALGITDNSGNYSASEYNLGPEILANNTQNSIFVLAEQLYNCEKITHVPKIIHDRNLLYLKISVGSEIGTMLRPNEIWVGNKRTVFTHLIIKHNWNIAIANEELELYTDNDRNSEMNYQIWRDIYLSLDKSLERLILDANQESNIQNVSPGVLKYLWADAIASEIYAERDNL